MRVKSWKENEELTFTKEDRKKVFDQLHHRQRQSEQKKPFTTIAKQFSLASASLIVVGLCILLFFPTILFNNTITDSAATNPTSVGVQNEKDITALFSIKNENNRTPLNLLVSFNAEKDVMKVLSIPRDAYVPILDSDGESMYDKLAHAYAYGGSDGAKNIKTSVSELFDVNIDYYAVLDLDTFSAIIDSVNGIEYDLEEEIRVRAITQAVFDLPKGTNQLNGEEVVALIMDATNNASMGTKDIEHLLNSVMIKLFSEIPKEQLKDIMVGIEGNIPYEIFDGQLKLPQVQLLSLTDGMIPVVKDELYFVEFEEEFLDSVLEKFTTFE